MQGTHQGMGWLCARSRLHGITHPSPGLGARVNGAFSCLGYPFLALLPVPGRAWGGGWGGGTF